MAIAPLFKWFGSKWLSARLLPAPECGIIIEPFAGGAGYSLRHAERQVCIAEADVHIEQLWRWLITEASSQDICDIPLNVPEGTDIRKLGLSTGQALLLKNWQRTNNVGDCWTISSWGNKPGQWTSNTRARVAEQVHAVKHWIVNGRDAFRCMHLHHGEATWFIDAPYQFNYQYRKAPIDYALLAGIIRHKRGQRIVCEAVCPKTGAVPAWLPFKTFGERVTSRRKANNHHHSKELLWTDTTY